jgi:hypothetical protein
MMTYKMLVGFMMSFTVGMILWGAIGLAAWDSELGLIIVWRLILAIGIINLCYTIGHYLTEKK